MDTNTVQKPLRQSHGAQDQSNCKHAYSKFSDEVISFILTEMQSIFNSSIVFVLHHFQMFVQHVSACFPCLYKPYLNSRHKYQFHQL